MKQRLSRRTTFASPSWPWSTAAIAVAAFGPSLASGKQGPRPDRQHGLHRGQQDRTAQIRRPRNDHRRRRTDDRQQDQPETGRPAHLLAGRSLAAPGDREGTENLLPERHLRNDRQMARRQRPEQPGDQEPGQGGQAAAGTPRAPRASPVTPGSPAPSRAPNSPRRSTSTPPKARRRSTSCARSIPGCRAKSSSCRRTSATTELDSASPRLGRRAFLGALGGGALASLLPLRGAVGAGSTRRRAPDPSARGAAVQAPLPIPRGAARRAPRRSRSARPRSRCCPAARRGCGPTAAASRGRRSGGRPASAPRSPSSTGCRSEAGELTVHLHGGHNRSEYDGQPGGLTASHPFSFYCRIPQRPAGARSRATTC